MRHRLISIRQALAGAIVRARRYRNWRAGAGSAARPDRAAALAPLWRWRLSLGLVLAAVLAGGGGAVIAAHALRLPQAAQDDTEGEAGGIGLYRDSVPGAVIDVPDRAGATVAPVEGGTVVVIGGMLGREPVRIDLCSQLRADGRLHTLRIGYRFADVPQPAHGAVLLAADDMPAVWVEGAGLDTPLRLGWTGAGVAWAGDGAAGGAMRRHGWLGGGGGGVRPVRRGPPACPRAGELVVQLYRPAAARPRCCTVIAFGARGGMQAGMLPPGRHTVPSPRTGGPGSSPQAGPDAGRVSGRREDQALFEALLAHGLLRVGEGGAIEVAPRDLPAWAAAAPGDRAAPLDPWRNAAGDADAMRLLRRLYRQADGDYVLRQIEIHNSELRMLAWRAPLPAPLPVTAHAGGPAESRAGGEDGWQALADGAPLPVTGAMPGAAARLFDALPQGWLPWRRAAAWPRDAALTLVHAGDAGPLRLMVAGRVGAVRGAQVRGRRDACTGAGCLAPGDVSEWLLAPDGGGPVTVTVQPLPAAPAAGDARYRHVYLDRGRPAWRALEQAARPVMAAAPAQGAAATSASPWAAQSAPDAGPAPGRGGTGLPAGAWPAGAAAMAPPAGHVRQVRIADRNGALLWADGAAVREAGQAGLSAMLGVAPEHASGVAGMLGRIPGGGRQAATLTLDLPLQARAQAILECVALRRGRWQGDGCGGGVAPPPGRQAGMVLLDAHTGDILAAAGAGNAPAGSSNWREVRDFDRANPARSPLRIPAWQHDGGVHRSPGSTFKVVSALGLELAARNDRQLDALLDGMAPADINRMAHGRGYDFGTAAPSYPVNGRARITNYREQGLEHRVQDGRLGLRQALAYSQNTWFAWAAEWSDRSLLGMPDGGVPGVQALEPGALDAVRPVAAAARRLGFGAPMRLDGGLLAPSFGWSAYDALQATASHIDPVGTRHEVRQMAIGLRMQATPLQMAVAAGAIGEGATVAPRLLQSLNGRAAAPAVAAALDVRLDRIRAGMKGVIDGGTAAGAFGGAALAGVRRGLYGKTGTAPTAEGTATVWFTGWLEPGTLPGQRRRLAFAVFASHSEASGGEHAAPVVAALLSDPAAVARLGGMAGKEGENAR